MNTTSKISQFYKNKCVFITGGTGFVGQGTIEKLLRSCSDISKLYVLIRPKPNLTIQSRLEKLLESSIFSNIRSEDPDALAKIIPIAGDISFADLGMSEEDQKLLSANVSIVIHSAATVKFDEKLKSSVNTNVCGTQAIIKLCKKMEKLEALIHVSTAYANCDQKQVPESIRPSVLEPEKIIQCVNSLNDETVERITEVLIGNKPNTYTFTKALAENLLEKENGVLPICIVRPSIVTATYKDPLNGWVNNLNGPTGYIAAYGKGVLRTAWGHVEKIGDFIPLDYVVNMIVAAAWDVGTKKSESITVYNCCTGPSNPMFWRDFELWGPTAVKENPFNDILWYPNTMSHHSWFWHKISDICFQYVPAYLMDVLSRCNGQKPKMLKIYRKLNVAMTSFEYFTTREWDFENYNMQALYERMCPQDKILFTLNLKEINWPEYMKIYCLGVRKYILKEHPDTLPAARKHLRRMYWLDKSVKFFCILVLWYGIFRRSGRALRLKALILYILLKISSR